jgi:hypothetical protein
MVWRRDPSSPAIVCAVVSRITRSTSLHKKLIVPPMTPTVSTFSPFGAIKDGLPCPATALKRLISANIPSIVQEAEKFTLDLLGVDAMKLPGGWRFGIVAKLALCLYSPFITMGARCENHGHDAQILSARGLRQPIDEFASCRRDGVLGSVRRLCAVLRDRCIRHVTAKEIIAPHPLRRQGNRTGELPRVSFKGLVQALAEDSSPNRCCWMAFPFGFVNSTSMEILVLREQLASFLELATSWRARGAVELQAYCNAKKEASACAESLLELVGAYPSLKPSTCSSPVRTPLKTSS